MCYTMDNTGYCNTWRLCGILLNRWVIRTIKYILCVGVLFCVRSKLHCFSMNIYKISKIRYIFFHIIFYGLGTIWWYYPFAFHKVVQHFGSELVCYILYLMLKASHMYCIFIVFCFFECFFFLLPAQLCLIVLLISIHSPAALNDLSLLWMSNQHCRAVSCKVLRI